MFGVAKIASTDPTEKRFHGSCAFVRLHLMKAAEGDVEAGFVAARDRSMISEADEAYIRECFALDDQLAAAEAPSRTITTEDCTKLQGLINQLNMGDSC